MLIFFLPYLNNKLYKSYPASKNILYTNYLVLPTGVTIDKLIIAYNTCGEFTFAAK